MKNNKPFGSLLSIILISTSIFLSCTTSTNESKDANLPLHEYYVVSYDCGLEESCYKLEHGDEKHVPISQPELREHGGYSSAIATFNPPDSIGRYVLYIDGRIDKETIHGENFRIERAYTPEGKVFVEWIDSAGFLISRHFDPQSGKLSNKTITDPHGFNETYAYYEDGSLRLVESSNGNRKTYYTNGDLKTESIVYDLVVEIKFSYDSSGRMNQREYWLYNGTVGRTEILDENGAIIGVDMLDTSYQADRMSKITIAKIDSIAQFDNGMRHGWNTFSFSKGKIDINYDHDGLVAWKMEIWKDLNGRLLKDTLRYEEEY